MALQTLTAPPALDPAAGQALLQIARRSLEEHLCRRQTPTLEPDGWPPALHRPGATFVTLTRHGQLRGCIGIVQSQQPLFQDVAHNAVAAATRDPRFLPVRPEELPDLRLSVTILSPLRPQPYTGYDSLLTLLRPERDGVALYWNEQHGLLLPQVWRRIPQPADFLENICHKAAIPPAELHRVPPTVTVYTFQAQHFAEPGYTEPGGYD